MKQVNGIWLPDADTHFAAHLAAGPVFNGAGTYQHAKLLKAIAVLPVNNRHRALDVGGHVGLWSRVLASYFDMVTAFEPVEAHIECFIANTWELKNVTLIRSAIGDGATAGFVALTGDNSGNAHVAPSGQICAMATLDETVSGRVDFIKIDVEGYELPVIRGGKELISREKPVMVVEQKPGNAERYGFGRFDAVDLLKSWGYIVVWEKSGDYCLKFEE